jgi:hypothetical protein
MSRFAIVLAEQPHRLVFAEVVESLAWGLRELGHEVEAATRPIPGVRNIILAPHLLLASDEHVELSPGTIVYNGEPFVSPLFVRSLRLLGKPNVVAWDYSALNVEYLTGLSIPALHVPYAWAPPLCRWPKSGQAEPLPLYSTRNVDVLFVGSSSPRRVRVLEQLQADHPELTVKTLFGVYGEERDGWLCRSRVCLNMHYWDERPPNEDLRLLLACSNAVAVISEGTPDEPAKAEWAVWAPYSELVERTAALVASGEWKQQAALGYAAVQECDAVSVVKKALEGSSQ